MRHQVYLRSRYRALLGYIGQLFAIIGIIHLVPLLLIAFYPAEAELAGGFLLAGVPLIIAGLLIWKRYYPQEPISLTVQEGSVIVVTIWMVAILAATIPFMTINGLNFTQALFEATSGWTTTGLSVVDVTTTPNLLLFFRSFIQLAGGAGFAIIALSAGAGGGALWGLVAAEGRTDQLAPHVRQSASIVLRIYGSYIVFGILALRLAGMGWFDAVNHAFTALSTGGFSTRVESIGYWDSPAIEAVVLILMLLGTINFFIAYTLLQRKFRAVARSGELRFMGVIIAIGVFCLFFSVTTQLYSTLEKSLRVAIFEVTSAATTTGFSTVSYLPWADFGWIILITLMLIGGGTGSTAGGIKQMRIYILYKSIRWEIRRAFMPRHTVNEPAIWQGEKRELLNDRLIRQTALFVGLYFTILLIGTSMMAAYGYSLKDSLFEFASTLGTVGLSIGVTSLDMPPVLLWVQCLGMLMGRLEMFAVIVGLLKLVTDTGTMLRGRHQEAARG
jgi:trk system potassium uptake protein TrkH